MGPPVGFIPFGMATTGELGLGAQHLLAAASCRFGTLSGGGGPLARVRSQAFLARWRSRLAVTLTRELFAACWVAVDSARRHCRAPPNGDASRAMACDPLVPVLGAPSPPLALPP